MNALPGPLSVSVLRYDPYTRARAIMEQNLDWFEHYLLGKP
jgi:hypothetical protein